MTTVSREPRPRRGLQDRLSRPSQLGVTAATALATFLLAFDDGSFALETRNAVAIAVWWSVGLLVLSRSNGARMRTELPIALGLLTVFTAWSGLSAAWSSDTERVFSELGRNALYLGAFVLVVLLVVRGLLAPILDGLALGLLAVAALALTSRFLPELASLPAETARDLPVALVRLSYPIAYWNALGILVALAAPLLLRVALASPLSAARASAVAGLPLIATTIELTSSRGAAAVAAVGAVAFLAFAPRRWAALAALVAGTIGSLIAIESVHAISGGESVGAGQAEAAVLVLAACAVAGALYWFWETLLAPSFSPAPIVGWVLTGGAIVVLVAAVIAAHPLRRFEEFKQPASREEAVGNDVRTSFGEASGSGRWQYWQVAWNEFEESPLHGGGAGSYETFWAQNGNLPRQIRDVHSLWIETLAELGIAGFLLLVGFFAAAAVAGVRSLRVGAERLQVTTAAALACLGAFAVAAAIDWMWEIPAVTLPALVCAAVLVAQRFGTAAFVRSRAGARALLAACAVVAPAAIVVEALPLLSQLEVERSQAAVQSGDLPAALERAVAARKITPWAASPYLQLALVNEVRADYATALAWLARAIERDPQDWQLWLVRARIETEAGRIEAARRSLARARELNPRSSIFSTG